MQLRRVRLAPLQGVAGVACVAVGAGLLGGLAWALLALGAFLLLAAWGAR